MRASSLLPRFGHHRRQIPALVTAGIEFALEQRVDIGAQIAARTTEVHYEPGDMVYEEGQHAEGLFLLVEGEIELRGPNVFGGYWERPEATAEAFTRRATP